MKFTIALFLSAFAVGAFAQTPAVKVPGAQAYGKVDMADLQMTACDFEKDANAEVLFDVGNVYQDGQTTIMERHIRVKVFNNFGTNVGNVRLECLSYLGASVINNLQGQTINLENGKIEITKLDPKTVFTEMTDKFRTTLVFALPKIKAGSIIEYKYRSALSSGYFPNWYFQSRIPTRYSEITTDFPGGLVFRVIPHVQQAYVKDVGKRDDYTQVKALANVHSLPEEPYTDAVTDNLQRMEYLGLSTKLNSWDKIGAFSVKAGDFGIQVDNNISGERDIIKHAKTLKTNDEKIAFIYDTVKKAMQWNDRSLIYTTQGTQLAWDRKTGNSAEVNMILCHMLQRAGVNAWPMIISTKKNGKLNPANPNFFILNSTVVFIPVDSTRHYVLDATNKYNLYNQIPADNLNTFGLYLDEHDRVYETIFLQNNEPVMQSVFLNAEIKPEGKLTGSAELTSYSYNKIGAIAKYKTIGEEKYIKYLCNNDNNVKISSLKLEGMEVDTLPLSQKIEFSNDLAGADEHYLYFNANLFSLMGDNPFKSEERYSDIDLGYRNNFSLNGIYKLPAGYKTDALPKSMIIVMPDESIMFKRTVVEDNGTVLVKYALNHKKTLYFKEDYQDIRGFYKKMYELMNEQIVLKKS